MLTRRPRSGRIASQSAGPDRCREFAIGYEILELVEPDLISDPMPEVGMHEPTVVRVELHDHGAKTHMTLSDSPLPPEGRGPAEAGWTAAFDKLAALFAG